MSYESIAVQSLSEVLERFGSRATMKMSRYSSGESFVLHYLVFRKGPSSPSELLEKAGTSSARIAAILRSLETKGHIIREVDAKDRRKTIVNITPEGNQRAIKEYEEMAGALWEIFHRMGKEDTEEFIRIFERFLDILVTIDEDSCKPFAPSKHAFLQNRNSVNPFIVEMSVEEGADE